MKLTYKQARAIAKAHVADYWLPEDGTLYADKAGLQDADAYLVPVGARELLRDGDEAYLMLGGGVVTVEKATGQVFMLDSLLDLERIDAMIPAE